MTLPRLVLLLGGFALFMARLVPAGRAQVYAPDTEYHDRAQRHFVVELSRVLAWRENQHASGPKVEEITFEVGTTADHATHWNLHWLDAQGRSLREATVSYPTEALATGPAWYRDVWRQLGGTSLGATADAVAGDYWQGVDSAEPSRAASVLRAFDLQPERQPARLAGLLAQAALPGVARRVSLDGVLLARAAAWLCVAEGSVKAAAPSLDALWTPILFLSGREFKAAEVWKSAAVAPSNPAAKWWGFMVSHPSSQRMFAGAADPQYRRWAVPMLLYEAQERNLNESIFSALTHLVANEEALVPWHDYGPFLELNTSIGGGRLLEGRWPALSRAAFVGCLTKLKPAAADFQGYSKELTQASAFPKPAASGDDPCLAGWNAAAPLIDLGYHEGQGKLIPVGTVTARDLLNYGWEMSGLQMGARWHFLHDYLGVPEDADAVARAALGAVEGSEVFFVADPFHFDTLRKPPQPWQFATLPHLRDFARLEEIGGLDGAWAMRSKVFDKDKGKNALLWVQRNWLLPDEILFQHIELFFGHRLDDIGPTLSRIHREGGPSTDYGALSFYAYGLTPTGVKKVQGSEEVRLDLLRVQTEPTRAGILVLQRYDPLPPFESAQRLEKLFWQRPGDDLPYTDIFSDYLRGHAYAAAKRFYAQAEPYLKDPVGFSDQMGPRRFTLAMLEGDRAGMTEALTASSSGSYADIIMNVMAAMANEDYRAAGKLAEGAYRRYPSEKPEEDMALKLTGFLPLVPALKDPAHPDHAKALDYFGSYKKWPTLQWVVLTHAKLSPEEAVRFLGGDHTDPERRLLAAYVLKDEALFTKTYDETVAAIRNDVSARKNWQNMAFVVVHWLRNDLLAVPVPAEQPDLKPAGAQSLLDALSAKPHR